MGRILKFDSKKEFEHFLLNKIKVDVHGIKYLSNKYKTLHFYFQDIPNAVCNIIKQEMISSGGDASVSEDVAKFKDGISNILIYGNEKNIRNFIAKSSKQTKTVKRIGEEINSLLNKKPLTLILRDKKINLENKYLIMGILNITPDSFYDGGRYKETDVAVKRAEEMLRDGADIIDIGGESTRPGAEKIDYQEEIDRVIPILKRIRKITKKPISVDTYKSEVAEVALTEGADIINDISGLRFDKRMAKIIAKHNGAVVVMHIKGTPKTMQINPQYTDLISEIKNYLEGSIKISLENGIIFNKIIVDPGIGFGKSVADNYTIINKLNEFKVLNRPILMGLSRKSLIGKVLNNEASERLNGTVVLNAISILNGANIIRVHDVKEHREIIRIIKFLKKNGEY